MEAWNYNLSMGPIVRDRLLNNLPFHLVFDANSLKTNPEFLELKRQGFQFSKEFKAFEGITLSDSCEDGKFSIEYGDYIVDEYDKFIRS